LLLALTPKPRALIDRYAWYRIQEGCLMLKVILSLLGFAVVALIVLVAGFVAWGFYQSYEVRKWDAKIEALCAANDGKDVATRVYETVMAPETKEYFRDTTPVRSLGVPSRSEGVTLGPQYPYVTETRTVEVLNHDNPSVVKYTERIVRTSDNKILAERYGYQRADGGTLGIDHGEIRNCPDNTLKDSLEINVFLNHSRRSALEEK